MINKSNLISDKIENVLKTNKFHVKFDIFFLDPPFASNSYINFLEFIKNNKIFNVNHVVIIHREKNSRDNLQNLFKIVAIKNYGRSKLIFGKFN